MGLPAPAAQVDALGDKRIGAVLIGELAVGLCVLAVAFVGFLMMSGRVPITGSSYSYCYYALGEGPALGVVRVQFLLIYS